MLFSLITPTHSLKYITELYETLAEQSYKNWEWVLYVNGNANNEIIPEQIRNDDRVRIYNDITGNTNVGYLKKKAFLLGKGEVLIEMDHDDMLTDNCLKRLFEVFTENPDVGFVYSDNAKLHMQNKFIPYNPYYGWTHSTMKFKGRELTTMHSFAPDAASMAFIWYMPDHVRAWRKNVYLEVGGHDDSLAVLDDQDLIVRTYLHTKFYHIKEPLYIYRITGDNTWIERNKDIQTGTVTMYHKYAQQLAFRDCQLNNTLAVDMGGGINGLPGYLTIDQKGADINCDLNNGIPIADNSVGLLHASHTLEHLRDPLKSMREIHRVLCDGGWAFIDVPSTDGRGAWMDPTHISYWNENSFWYYTRKESANFIRNSDIRFQEFRLETLFPNDWYRQGNIPVSRAWLRAIKSDKRRPHPIKI